MQQWHMRCVWLYQLLTMCPKGLSSLLSSTMNIWGTVKRKWGKETFFFNFLMDFVLQNHPELSFRHTKSYPQPPVWNPSLTCSSVLVPLGHLGSPWVLCLGHLLAGMCLSLCVYLFGRFCIWNMWINHTSTPMAYPGSPTSALHLHSSSLDLPVLVLPSPALVLLYSPPKGDMSSSHQALHSSSWYSIDHREVRLPSFHTITSRRSIFKTPFIKSVESQSHCVPILNPLPEFMSCHQYPQSNSCPSTSTPKKKHCWISAWLKIFCHMQFRSLLRTHFFSCFMLINEFYSPSVSKKSIYFIGSRYHIFYMYTIYIHTPYIS